MASPGNRHCANCIGTLSFPIRQQAFILYHATEFLVQDKPTRPEWLPLFKIIFRNNYKQTEICEYVRFYAERALRDAIHDTRCYSNVCSKADMSQLNLPHGTDN